MPVLQLFNCDFALYDLTKHLNIPCMSVLQFVSLLYYVEYRRKNIDSIR